MTYIDRPAPLIRRDPASEYDLPPHPNPHLAVDTDDAARSWARYRDGLERASRKSASEQKVEDFVAGRLQWDRPEVHLTQGQVDFLAAHRSEDARRRREDVSPPKLSARDHVRLFVQAAVAMLVVVAVLLACAWIGAR